MSWTTTKFSIYFQHDISAVVVHLQNH